MKFHWFLVFISSSLSVFSCRTVDFEKQGPVIENEKNYNSLEEEQKAIYDEAQEFLIQESLKEIDVPKTVVYIEKPVYYPLTEEKQKPDLKGKDAAKKSTEEALQSPDKWTNGTMYYDFDGDFTYEIYCQPYRVTDLILEPGEQVIEMPFLSEEKVWEIGAGVSRHGGVDTQHFFLKPAYSGLVTSFIIITDKRVYHLLLKAYKDCYMTQVKWNYPNTMPFNLKTDAMQQNKVNKMTKETTAVDPAYLSFDYKMSYSMFKKPYWLPTRVYDDGKHTYIVMNETVLHMTSPVIFNNKNERINYSVNRTLIIIPELIEKITMRVGKEKVVIKKKYYKEPEPVKIEKTEEIKLDVEPQLPPADMQNSFNGTYNSSLQKETAIHSSDIFIESKIMEEKKKKTENMTENDKGGESN